MEVELVGCEPGEVRVLHEPFTLGSIVVLDEVREAAMTEAKGNTLPLHVLLTHASDNLGDVDLRTLGTSCHHDFEVVELGEGLLCAGSSLVSGLVEDPVDLVFEGLP